MDAQAMTQAIVAAIQAATQAAAPPPNFAQDLQNAVTAAIQAAGAPQVPSAGPFALFPATVTSNAIDYTTSSGSKIFKAATEVP
jgi:hypothetical protein